MSPEVDTTPGHDAAGVSVSAPAPSPVGAPSARLLSLFANQRLTPIQRRIAQYLVDNASRAGFLSSNDLAELAGVSQPSVTRFAVAMGFRGYTGLQREIRRLVIGIDAESAAPARQNEWQHAVALEARNLDHLREVLADPGPVENAGRILMASRPLVVLGLRAAAPLAWYIGYFAAQVHPDVRVVTGGDSGAVDRLQQARAAGGSAMCGVLMPRYPREALTNLRAAHQMGFAVVTLTDAAMSPAAEYSEILLAATTGSSLVFDSYAGPMVLAALLLQSMCDAAGTDAQRRLEDFERSALDRNVFSA